MERDITPKFGQRTQKMEERTPKQGEDLKLGREIQSWAENPKNGERRIRDPKNGERTLKIGGDKAGTPKSMWGERETGQAPQNWDGGTKKTIRNPKIEEVLVRNIKIENGGVRNPKSGGGHLRTPKMEEKTSGPQKQGEKIVKTQKLGGEGVCGKVRTP